MRLFKTIKISFFLIFSIFAFIGESWAIMASASVDRNVITLDETITLSIEVIDDPNGRARQPAITVPGFRVSSSGVSSSIVVQNGRISATRIYSYVLVPKTTGKMKIPSVRIDAQGEYTETQPISVEVIKGSYDDEEEDSSPKKKTSRKSSRQGSQYSYGNEDDEDSRSNSYSSPSKQGSSYSSRKSGSSEPLLLIATTDKTSVYPGEQVTLSVTFYTAVPLADNPQYTPPTFKNFISEELPPVRNGQKSLESDGPMYGYSEIKTALFALSAGKGDIMEASVSANVVVSRALDPFDPNFIQNFMSGGFGSSEKKVLKSKPISIRVKPLPSGAPESFNGAVGSYSMRSIVEKGNYKEGEPLNFTVTVSGTGNLKSVTTPKFPESADFKVFDTQVSSTQNKTNDRVGGKKVFTYLIVPRSHGRKTIPSLRFSYFDPSSGHYYTLNTKAVEIEVAKGDTAAKNVYFNQPVGGEQVVTATASDIKYVTERSGLGFFGRMAEMINSLPFWIHSLPLIVFVGILANKKFSSYRNKNTQLFLFRGARSKAYRKIDDACDMIKAGQPAESISMLYDAFMDYLSNKCGEKVSAMQVRKALDVIHSKFPKVEQHELDSIRDLWQELEMHHYAPGQVDSVSAEGLAERCRIVLKMLDGKLK